MTGAVIAGSYPAALHIHRQKDELMWLPSDIDIWVDAENKANIITDSYRDSLSANGISRIEIEKGDYFFRTVTVEEDSDSEVDSNLSHSLQSASKKKLEDAKNKDASINK